jgi:uncharacterized membrane protein YgcG
MGWCWLAKPESPRLMRVAMMKVGEVCMAMAQWRMPMRMRMWLRAFLTEVRILVVFIVDVSMLVLHGLVLVLMQVALAQRKPGAGGGQREGRRKRSGHGFAETSHGQGGAEERRCAEVRGGASGSEMP